MAEKKYLDNVGLDEVAQHVNRRLKVVSVMPASADVGATRLYTGTTSADYTKGGIYQYNGTNWELINATAGGSTDVDIATVERVGIVRPDNETIFIKEDGTIYTHVWAGTLDRYYAVRDKLPNDTAIIIIDYDDIPDDDYYVNGVKIVSWSKGSDQEIVDMIDGARAGKINLYDYWTVGDERTVHLSAISANPNGAFTTAMPEQDVVWVIGDLTTPGHPAYPNQTVGTKLPYLVWVQKDCLNQKARMSSQNEEADWGSSLMRADLNTLYYDAIPTILKNSLVPFETITANTNEHIATWIDKIALAAEKEIVGLDGAGQLSTSIEFNTLEQISYYGYGEPDIYGMKNQLKKDSDGHICDYWMRSKYIPQFTNNIYMSGSIHNTLNAEASEYKGVAPFGCM